MALSRKDVQRLGWTVGAVLVSLLGGLAIAHAAVNGDKKTDTTVKSATTVKAVQIAEKAVPAAKSEEKAASTKVKSTASAGKPEFVGAETCLACHEDQGNSFKHSIHARKMPGRKNLSFERSCETCHGPGSLHADAAGDKDNAGFATIRKPSDLKGEEANASCLSCHKGGAQMHWMGSAHESKNVSCVSCHSVHQAEKGAKKALLKTEDPDLCYNCHLDKKSQMKRSAHMPVKEGGINCTSCHNPHGSVAKSNLKGDTVNDNCYMCHQDKRSPKLHEHPPVRENCLTCHEAHGSHHDKMLKAKAPMLCQRCHISGRHPSTPYEGGQLNSRSNRLTAHGCANCHSQVHGSNHPSGNYFER